MKKVFISALIVCVSVMFANAQGTTATPAKTDAKAAPAKTAAKAAAKTDAKAAPAKTAAKTDAKAAAAKIDSKAAPAKTAATNTKSTAKAGASSTTQHLKKDGTPDMRYKDNKAAATKPATAKGSTTTPDKK